MRRPLFYITILGLISHVVMVSAQPGPITILNNSNLVLAASTLLTNGLPGLSGPPVTLMVSAVQPTSAQGGAASLVDNQPWVDRYNGAANSEDQATAIAVDNSGNIIVGGYSTETLGTGYTTIKYTPDGIGLWTNHYGSLGARIESVAVDGSGGVYVGGLSGGTIVLLKYTSGGVPVWTNTYTTTNSSLFFGGMAVDANGNVYMLPNDPDTDSFITVKYDVNGNPAWTNFFRASPISIDNATGVAVDSAGNVFVTGFDAGSGTTFLTFAYRPDGSIYWINTYSLMNSESATSVIVDPQGNVIVAGDSQGGTAQQTYPIVKYSNSGTQLWANDVAAAGYVGGGVPAITTDLSGNIFVVGGTPGSSSVDYTTIKFSSAGVPLWTNRFADPNGGSQALFGAATDNSGNIFWSIESASPNGTNYNYVTLKYNANGTPVWTNRYTGPSPTSDNTPRAMTVDKAGGAYATGASSSAGQSFGALDWATVKYADNLRYVPPPHFVGQDTVTFTAFDSFGNSAVGTLTINVLAAVVPIAVAAPVAYTSVSGDSGLNTLLRNTNNPRTYQMQFTSNALGGLPVGAQITALGFRLISNSAVSFPAATVNWSDYEITLAQAANPISSMSTTFSANLLNPVLVKSGKLSIGANQFSAGGNPNAFGTLAVLNTPYVYQGGDLVMYFTHNGSDSATTPPFLDSASTLSPGYGTSYRALSATTLAATTATATASVTIVEIIFTPTITQSIAGSGNQIIINGTGGLGGATYRILTTTNVALPVAQWTPIATNQFTAGGGFSYTNVVQSSQPAQFFRVSLP